MVNGHAKRLWAIISKTTKVQVILTLGTSTELIHSCDYNGQF